MLGIPSFRIIELVLLGDGFVGKTALLQRFKNGVFVPEYRITVGADFVVKKIQLGNTQVTLQIWDVGGQPQFSSLRSRYYKNAAGAIIVFDICKRDTFESIPIWLKEVLENNNWRLVPITLVANKQDLTREREVTPEEIAVYVEQLKEWGLSINQEFQIQFVETSAKYGTNVDEAFVELVVRILESLNRPSQ